MEAMMAVERQRTSESVSKLDNSDIILIGTFAGLGHNRVLTSCKHGLQQLGLSAQELYLEELQAGKVHSWGSGGLGQVLTEFAQDTPWLQHRLAWFHRQAIGVDWDTIFTQTYQAISKCPKKDVLLQVFHPDVGFVLGEQRDWLSKLTHKNLTLGITVTDHLPYNTQTVWSLVGADVIVTPDDGSADIIRKDLVRWSHNINGGYTYRHKPLPYVITSAYPCDPRLNGYGSQELGNQDIWQRRRAQLDPNSPESLAVLCALGGSAPGSSELTTIAGLLKLSGIWVDILAKTSVKSIQMKAILGDCVELVGDNLLAIDRLVAKMREQVYGLRITKPSEQLADSICLAGDELGGSIMLLTSPVGNQEHQNLRWLREKGLIPELEVGLWALGEAQKGKLVGEARYWKGLCLPTNPHQAANFVKHGYLSGLFKHMFDGSGRVFSDPELSTNGAVEMWQNINSLLERVDLRN